MDWALIGTLLYLGAWLLFILALFVVPRNRKPSSATAWLMLIFLLPYLGLIIYLLIGSPKLSRARRAQQHMATDLIENAVARAREDRPEHHAILDPPILPRYEPFVRLNANLGGMPAFAGNSVDLLPDYDASIRCMTAEVERAQHFVHVEFFIVALDSNTEPFFVAMENAIKRGVKVRLLLDHMGSLRYPGRKKMEARLTAGGIEWHRMLPVRPFSRQWNRPDLRNHRKIVVIDGVVGFTGSINMIDKTYLVKANLKRGLYYVELVARVSGPIVSQLEATFATDWHAETGTLLDHATAPETAVVPIPTGDVLCQILPSGPGYDNDNNLKLFTALLYAAQRKIVIVNPYFVPDDALMAAITSAAQRNVDVTFFTSEIHDQFLVFHAQNSYYEELLRAGVKIYRYRPPVILHSKHMSIDDDIAVIGSSNLDLRSFTLNLEVTLITYSPQIVANMQAIFADYSRNSRPVLLDDWERRPRSARLFDNIARLTSALQ